MPLENPHTLQECFQIFIEKLSLIEDPFEQSFFALVQLSYMQSAQRYSAIQQAIGGPNLLKMKYRSSIQEIVRAVILEKIAGPQVVYHIHNLIDAKKLPETDAVELFQLIEAEIIGLHDGNIARFKKLD